MAQKEFEILLSTKGNISFYPDSPWSEYDCANTTGSDYFYKKHGAIIRNLLKQRKNEKRT